MTSKLLHQIQGEGYSFYVYEELPSMRYQPKTPYGVYIRMKRMVKNLNSGATLVRVYDVAPCTVESVLPWGATAVGPYVYESIPKPEQKEAFAAYQRWKQTRDPHWKAVPLELKKRAGSWTLCRSEWFPHVDKEIKPCAGWAWLKKWGSPAEELANAGVMGVDPELQLDDYLEELNSWARSKYYSVRVNSPEYKPEVESFEQKRYRSEVDALDSIWAFCLMNKDINLCLVDVLINFRWVQLRLFIPEELREKEKGDLVTWLRDNWSTVGSNCPEKGVPENAILLSMLRTVE